MFGEAATHAQAAKHEALSGTARIWQAAARTDAAQLTAAESLCRAAIVAGTLAGAERARGEATLARILLWQGRVSEAATRDFGIETDDHELAAFVAATSVRVSIASGDLFAAGQRARELLTLAEDTGHALVRVIALSAHLRVLIEVGDLALAERLLPMSGRQREWPARLCALLAPVCCGLTRCDGPAEIATRNASCADLRRLRGATPPLLRSAIDGRLRGDVRAFAASARL